ncbi:MAG TPA: TerB family tellurite resistance protein [Gemmatimonadaceae bacterium]|nr:TerB family tellurite resistance protein [Gemmatimonadaceae bacterium]
MLDAIRALLTGQPAARPTHPSAVEGAPGAPGAPDPVHLAACALLLDVAHADGEFSAAERAHLERVLARHFGLAPEEGERLLALAEEARRGAVDHYQFTSVLQRDYDTGQKMVLAEVMWGLALADGQIAEHEHYLTRKIANLLDLEPGYLSSAKAAAERRAPPPAERTGDAAR